MLNALAAMRPPSVRRSFTEPQQRQAVANALLSALDASPAGILNGPTATPGNGYEIAPSTSAASYRPDPSQPYALPEGPMAGYVSSYGPARPNPGGPEVTAAVRRAAAEVFGPEAQVVGLSGTGEHGSPRHRASASGRDTGHALDFRVQLPGGELLSLDDPRSRDFALTAARYGVTGLGAGDEYMGPNTFHMDTFPLDRYSSGMGRAWGSWGDRIEADFLSAFGG